ncbi:MAG: helix-turn-helix domain-containing protein [Rhodospirillaceae bacterium]
MLGVQTGASRAPHNAPLARLADNAAQRPAAQVHDPLAALDPLKTAGTRMTVKRGEEIAAEGSAADYCYKVVSGSVRLVKLVTDGRRQVCEFLVAGDFIGITADSDHYFTAEATADSVLIRLPRRQVESLIAANPALAQYVHKLTTTGLQRAYERMVLICHKSAHERIAWFLLEMGKRSAGTDSFQLPMTRADIADYLGLVIETVSRVLTQFKVSGTIAIRNINRITLLDRDALEAATGEA